MPIFSRLKKLSFFDAAKFFAQDSGVLTRIPSNAPSPFSLPATTGLL